MATNVTLNGSVYAIPAVNEDGWGDEVRNYLVALATSITSNGGTFSLTTADLDLGASYGIKSIYYKSRSSNIADADIVRLANNEGVSWRNAANDGNLGLKVNASDVLEYNSADVLAVDYGADNTILAMSGSSLAWETITNSLIDASAAIAYSKLNLTGAILNADLAGSIDRTKLATGTADHVIINDGSGDVSSEATLAKSRGGAAADMSSVTFPSTGTIVTRDAAETLTNKSGAISQWTNDSAYYGAITDVDINSAAAATVATGDLVLIADVDDSNILKKVTAQSIADLAAGGATLTQEQVEDFVGGMLGGTETLITVTYQDTTGDIDFVVDNDLANYSNATSAFYDADTDVDHDSTTNFVADAHILHAGVTLTAGSGLSGGGTIAASRTFNVDIDSESLVVAAVGDQVLIADASDTNAIKKVTVQTIVDLAGGGGTFGSGVTTSESTGDSVSTSATFATKVSHSHAVTSGQSYLIHYTMGLSTDSLSSNALARFRANGTVEHSYNEEPTDLANLGLVSGTFYYTAGATATQSFDIQFAEDGTGDCTANDASITMYRVV